MEEDNSDNLLSNHLFNNKFWVNSQSSVLIVIYFTPSFFFYLKEEVDLLINGCDQLQGKN